MDTDTFTQMMLDSISKKKQESKLRLHKETIETKDMSLQRTYTIPIESIQSAKFGIEENFGLKPQMSKPIPPTSRIVKRNNGGSAWAGQVGVAGGEISNSSQLNGNLDTPIISASEDIFGTTSHNQLIAESSTELDDGNEGDQSKDDKTILSQEKTNSSSSDDKKNSNQTAQQPPQPPPARRSIDLSRTASGSKSRPSSWSQVGNDNKVVGSPEEKSNIKSQSNLFGKTVNCVPPTPPEPRQIKRQASQKSQSDSRLPQQQDSDEALNLNDCPSQPLVNPHSNYQSKIGPPVKPRIRHSSKGSDVRDGVYTEAPTNSAELSMGLESLQREVEELMDKALNRV